MSFTACSEHVLWQHVATLSQPPSVTLSLTKFLAICSHFLLHNSLMEPTAHTLQKKIPTSAYTLEKAMAPHSSTLSWNIPWAEESGRLQSVHGVAKSQAHWATSLSPFTFMHWRRKWQSTPVFLPRDGEAWWAAIYAVAQSRTRLKRLSSSSSSAHTVIATILEVKKAVTTLVRLFNI